MPTVKAQFIRFRQKELSTEIIPLMKGDEMPLETEEFEESIPNLKNLSLKVTSSTWIPLNTEILIGSRGLLSGMRRSKDRCVFFGKGPSSEKLFVDYKIHENEKGIGKRHFMIRFNTELKKYQVKDLGDMEGYGTFIKINVKHKLKTGNVISFGEIHFEVTASSNELTIKFLEGSKANRQMYFSNVRKL